MLSFIYVCVCVRICHEVLEWVCYDLSYRRGQLQMDCVCFIVSLLTCVTTTNPSTHTLNTHTHTQVQMKGGLNHLNELAAQVLSAEKDVTEQYQKAKDKIDDEKLEDNVMRTKFQHRCGVTEGSNGVMCGVVCRVVWCAMWCISVVRHCFLCHGHRQPQCWKVHAYIPSCIHTLMHTLMHTYTHTYPHTYTHAYSRT